ncbi:UNVERIFIED_CONTAM: putative LRR receptor-like serine/threonine-protein kinase IRK [Sesamum angustifolium]|uniref:LRR receptor-like serine/threonine-protein kinase IRK n=1 Tax=Sesamum angustifolium TaxID=2727405 RepID=A0AAW2LF37_9LAMI
MRNLLGVFFFIFLSPFLVKSLSPSLNDDVLGLIVFKADIRDPDGKLSSWNEDDDSPCNNWIGVKCNPRSNRVSELVLDGFGLSGKLGRGLLQLQFLQKLSLAKNNLTGSLSLSLAQLSDLRVLDLSDNGLWGSISSDFFMQCGSLRSISLARNKFSGPIPESLGSCSTLTSVNFSGNQFLGPLPSAIWSMPALKSLDLSDNMLEGEISQDIEGLNNLRVIRLRNNKFTGEVPDGIGNCLLLRSIDVSQNLLSGGLPSTMQKLSLCNVLLLARNQFTWEMPEWIGEMRSLETVDFSENNFTGQLPDSLGKLQSLKILNVSTNALTGSLPETMRNCINLVAFDTSHNSLTAVLGDFGSLRLLNMSMNSFLGSIPANIGQLKKLNILDLSDNQLNGSIPSELGGLSSLDEMRLGKNSLGGEIPLSIGNCASLKSLCLAHNEITGSFPASLAKLSNLQIVDLCFNKLTGTLPKQLANLVRLQSFNISHNQLEGELPAGGFFNTISPSSVSGNPSLCGAAVNRSCPTVLPKPIVLNPNSSDATPGTVPQTFGHGKKILSISALIAIGAAAAIVIGVIAITVLNLRVRSSMSRSAVALTFSGGDDFSHSPSTDGRSIAIKKLTVSSLVKSQEEFEREVKKLGKVRHVNLVALDGYYWTPSLQLLIYEYVPGGNLYKHLHEGSNGNYLSWNERFNIILGAAKGLAHLHQMKVIHYNLKSSNILIDSSGEPKVADYGLARLLPMLDRYVLSSKIQSALGYMAPEFACKTVKITEKCDVYGFGILVLEIVTGKRPVEYMEDDVVVLCDMVRGSLEEGKVEECVDDRLQGKFPAEEAIPVMKLGLICTSQVPSNRPDMAEVVNILELIRCPSESQDELGDFS